MTAPRGCFFTLKETDPNGKQSIQTEPASAGFEFVQ